MSDDGKEPGRTGPAPEGAGDGKAVGEKLTRVAAWNIALLLAGAVGLFGWSTYFYEWNVGAWLAVPLFAIPLVERLGKLVPAFGKTVHRFIQRRLLPSRVTLAVLVAALAAALVAASFAGGVQVASKEPGGGERRLLLRPEDGEPRPLTLAAGETIRRPFWTGWGDPTRVTVTVARQAVGVDVRPWRRATVRVRDTFETPVVVLRPSVALFDQARALGAAVEVGWDGRRHREPWQGQLVLLGCPPHDVCAFAAGEEAAKLGALHRDRPASEEVWGAPLRLGESALSPGDRVEFTVDAPGLGPVLTGTVEVGSEAAIQVEDFDDAT